MKNRLMISVILFIVSAGISQTFGQTTSRPSSWGVRITSTSLENLYRVSDELYRSEQPDKKEFVELSTLGIKSSLNLRTTETDDELIGKCAIKPFLVPMDAGGFTNKEIIAALKVIKTAPKPILVHCRHGSDRTGVVVAMYRIVFQGWTKEDALNELLNGGYGFHTNYKNIPEYIKTVSVEAIKKGVNE